VKAQGENRKKPVKLSEITVVILAGGLGTRLRPIVSNKPKVLAEVLGRPFLKYLFDQLVHAGAREVVLCTGYMADSVREEIGGTYGSLCIKHSMEDVPLDTGGALRLALPLIRSDTVMVMNGDSYVNADFKAFLEWFLRKNIIGALLLAKVLDSSRYGRVVTSSDDHIETFEEKGGFGGEGFINAGVYLLQKKVVETIPPGKTFSLERELFPSLIRNKLYGYECKGEFIDIGTPKSFLEAEKFFSGL
jgi:D-glycero-alpha-D-manno-heptose 1-phosphate guanylyltransferase